MSGTKAIWIELIGFDNRLPDQGVEFQLNKIGFTPDAVILLIWSNDFVHSHDPSAPDSTLLGWDCSSYGCRKQGMEHDRQQWTKGELKSLIAGLKKKGCQVYLSFFDQVFSPSQVRRFEVPEMPDLWVRHHPEIFFTTRDGNVWDNICPWKRLSDGTYYEDFFVRKLLEVLRDYGFTGYHGADGYAHQRMPLYQGDFSDDMAEQSGIVCEAKCDGHPDRIRARAEEILLHHRMEWIQFVRERYRAFWRHVAGALKQGNFKLILNSFWCRDPFEALWRYGADYTLLNEIQPDALILEAPFADELEIWHSTNVRSIYKYMAAFLRIKALIPEIPVWYMNGVRDVLEEYNPVQHFPALLEAGTEQLNHALYFHQGQWHYPLAGLLACLSDGLTRENWVWVRELWAYVLNKKVIASAPCAAVVWSESMLEREWEAYSRERFASSFHLHWLLLGAGAPLNGIVPLSEVRDLPPETPLVVLNSRFLAPDERTLLEKRGGALLCFDAPETKPMSLDDPNSFTTDLPEPEPSPETIEEWCQRIRTCLADRLPEPVTGSFHLRMETQEDGTALLSLFNDESFYRKVKVTLPFPAESILPEKNVFLPVQCEGNIFALKLPPSGMAAVRLRRYK